MSLNPIKNVRERFALVPGQHRPRTVRNGAVFLAIVAGLVYVSFTSSIPFLPKGGTLHQAEFDTVDYMRNGMPVRVAGVQVGEIDKVERQADSTGGLITFRMTNPDIAIKRDAHANLWYRNLLGFAYEMELFPGSKDSPKLPGDEPIAQYRNESQLGFDDALQPLDPFGRAAVRGFLKEVDEGWSGKEAGQTIDRLGPAADTIAPAMDSLQGVNRGDLSYLVDRTGAALRGVGRHEKQLVGLLVNGSETLDAIGDERRALGTVLEDGPETLRDTRVTMARLRRTFDELDPTAEELRPGARALDETADKATIALREAQPLLVDARVTLHDLEPAVSKLYKVSLDGPPLMDNLEPSLENTDKRIVPWLNKVDRRVPTNVPNATAIPAFLATIGSSAGPFNSLGHMQNFSGGAGESLLGGLVPCDFFTTNGTPDQFAACRFLAAAETIGATGTLPPGSFPLVKQQGKKNKGKSSGDPLDGLSGIVPGLGGGQDGGNGKKGKNAKKNAKNGNKGGGN